jgi:subtilisin-like proprotein convertase family protein
VTWFVGAGDNCLVTNVVSVPPSGSTFPVGVTTVTNVASDASGNTNRCTFTVTVQDQQPPTLTCPTNIITKAPQGGDAVTNLLLGTPVVTDNCAVGGVTNNAPAYYPVGTNFVRWTAFDVAGNTSVCTQTVEVLASCSGLLSATPLANKTICANQLLEYQTTATSRDPITYTWTYNGEPIRGETNNSLSLLLLPPYGGGTYAVEVRTPCVSVTNTATVTMNLTPTVDPIFYANTDSIVISDFGEGVPYGSPVVPLCVPGIAKKVTVHLYGYWHDYPSDVCIVLASPDNRQVRLMTAAGTNASIHPPVDLTFSDDATNFVSFDGPVVSGTYRPTDYRPDILLPPPAAGPYATSLSAFIGAPLNGAWRLYVYDFVQDDGGGIASWSLEFEWREGILQLWNPKTTTNGGFQFDMTGQTGIPTIIEASSNQSTWQRVATNVLLISPWHVTVPAPQVRQRFYRAFQP